MPRFSPEDSALDGYCNGPVSDPGRPFQYAESPGGDIGEIGVFADCLEQLRFGESLECDSVLPAVDAPVSIRRRIRHQTLETRPGILAKFDASSSHILLYSPSLMFLRLKLTT